MSDKDFRFCKEHWTGLVDATKAKGLWAHVPQTGAEAAKRMANYLNGSKDSKDYDPLMDAHNMILRNALVCSQGQTKGCPLCDLDQHQAEMKETSKDWIDQATNATRKHCIELKLIEEPSA